MQVEWAKFFIAGVQYAQGKTLRLYQGEYLILQKEPNNSSDAYAIAIYKGKHKLGYVPKAYNQTLYAQMDELEIVVEDFFADAPPWERVWVSVFSRE